MQFNVINTDFLPVLPNVPEGGMLYYLQTECLLRGRRHQNTFFMSFRGGEKSVFDFFADMTSNVMNRLLTLQSIQVLMTGFWFVKLFPPPYVIMFVPYILPGRELEAATESKNLAIAAAKTEQQGRRSWGRKLLFGMPASWVDDDRLSDIGLSRINSHVQTWQQLFAGTTGESEYSMGKMDRWINHVYRSPLNPINYWPYERFLVRPYLVKHKHPRASRRWPIS